MTVSNELLYTTLQSLRKQRVDTLFKTTPLLGMLKARKAWKVGNHGPRIDIPLVLNTHSTLSAFPTGTERANRTVRDVMGIMQFNPADLGAPLWISRKEEAENSGDGMVVKIATARWDAAMGGAKREVNKQLIAGSSVVGNQAGLNTLYGHSSVTANGFLEGRTSQTNTVGGLAKSNGQIGLKNQWADCNDDFSVYGLGAMNSLAIDTRHYSELGTADMIIASSTMFANYKASLFGVERFTQKDPLDAGRLSLVFDDAEMQPDADMPTNATADFEASAYFLSSKGIEVDVWSGCDFDMDPWTSLANGEQVGRVSFLYLKLQLVARSLASCGFLSDGNTN